MTLKSVRAFARTIADWCLDHDDLLGYAIDAHEGGVCVRLDWDHRWSDAREFTIEEVQTMSPDDVAAVLGMMADEFRLWTAKFRDSGRLPG